MHAQPPDQLTAAWIRRLRGSMTQEKFAERLGIPNKGMVSKWENGRDKPMAPAVAKLLRYAREVHGTGLTTMTVMERQLLEHFRMITDDDARFRAYDAVVTEAAKFSQTEAAREPKA